AEASNTTIDSLTETPDYKANATAEYSVTARTAKSGTIIYFAVVVNAENYPASFNVEIKKTANSEDTYDYAEVKATLTKQTAPEGKELYGVAMDGTAVLVKGSDGYYHLGTADGTIVYVNITGALESNRFYDAIALAYPELSNVPLDLTHNKAEAGAPEQIVDYTKFLRGFSANEYVYNMMRQPTIPDEDDITTEVYYAKYVDENGMYPLNQELYDFLHLLCEVNQELLLESWAAELPAGTTAENAWLFPLYYYGEPTPADPIVGEYKFYSLTEGDNTYYVGDAYDGQNMTVFFGLIDGKLTADVDVLRIAKNLSFTILAYMTDLEAFDESMPIDTGMCVNNGDGTYTLTTDNADMMGTSLTYNAEDGTFSYFDGSATIVFKAANA
ncbi:MAG: hypothetical protein K2N47_02900, partial [Clostridia bacterium]|nr:hypothetical protein [Clostridia bacterium]